MKLVKNYEKEPEQFDSSMLKIGQMMECNAKNYEGLILFRTADKIISLSNPTIEWFTTASLTGRLLQPGESITLIQE